MGPMKNLDIITHTSIIVFTTIVIIINIFLILFQHSGKLTHSVKRTKPQICYLIAHLNLTQILV